MSEDPIQYLKTHQVQVGLAMLRHCRILATTRYGWKSHQTLPLGKDPETIVLDVITAYLEGERNFSPGHSLISQLKQGVRSHLSALYNRKESQAESLDASGVGGAPFQVPVDGLRPDDAAAYAHDGQVLFQMFGEHPKVKGNDELELVLLAIDAGNDDAASIAQATGIEVKRVYMLTRMLREIAPAVLSRFYEDKP